MVRKAAAAVALWAGFLTPGLAQTATPPAQAVGREGLDVALEGVATGVEVAGVAVIVLGMAAASVAFAREGLSGLDWPAAFDRYRANLGRGILLGLELLVAADIIGTVAVSPSLDNVAVLGLIVLIRTFLSFSLEVEIEGKWPWRRSESQPPHRSGGEDAKFRTGSGSRNPPEDAATGPGEPLPPPPGSG